MEGILLDDKQVHKLMETGRLLDIKPLLVKGLYIHDRPNVGDLFYVMEPFRHDEDGKIEYAASPHYSRVETWRWAAAMDEEDSRFTVRLVSISFMLLSEYLNILIESGFKDVHTFVSDWDDEYTDRYTEDCSFSNNPIVGVYDYELVEGDVK